jgi:hypothetical protein
MGNFPIDIFPLRGEKRPITCVFQQRGMNPRYPISSSFDYNEVMNTTPAQQSETPQTADEAWRRFTLLDLLVLFTGHEAGLGIMKWCGLLKTNLNDILDIFYATSLFLLFGSMISLPLIYGIQFLARHRSQGLTFGEVVGIANILIWGMWILTIALASNLPEGVMPLMGLYLIMCGMGSLFFLMQLFGLFGPAPCRWLDLYGYFQCVILLATFVSGFFAMVREID